VLVIVIFIGLMAKSKVTKLSQLFAAPPIRLKVAVVLLAVYIFPYIHA